MAERTIQVDYLARVEGEGSLHLSIEKDQLTEARLDIFEPPRFFEAFLRDRDFREAPDITARICGICPVAYQMGACHAMEQICGVTVGGPLRELRRLLYCGEWIESHALHVFMLHAPDFLGYQDAIEMAEDHGDVVTAALRLKKLGNRIMTLLGGREIHPINIKVGGFYKLPPPKELAALRPEIDWALEWCGPAIDLVKSFHYPDFEQDYEFLALRHPDEYPLNEGRLVSTAGIDVPLENYDEVLHEHQVPHSTSLHTHVVGRGPVHVGPLARYALNRDKLGPQALAAAERAGLGDICKNPFRSILVRMVELVFALEEATRILDTYEPPAAAAVPVEPRAGTGYGCTEAPRGICFHRYTINRDGLIRECKIVAPTSVNLAMMEDDLRSFAAPRLSLEDEQLQWQCEQAIRNYDPCISCSCHFLRVDIDRR